MRCLALSGLCSALFAIGCLFPSLDGLTPEAADRGVADAANAATDAELQEGGTSPVPDAQTPPPSGPNRLVNADFELGCGGWTPYNATLSEELNPHTGARSCRVCASSAGAHIRQDVATSVERGERYVAEAWVRDAPGATANPLLFEILFVDDAGYGEASAVTKSPSPTATWTRITAVHSVGAGSAEVRRIRFLLTVDPVLATDCFLIDDAALTRID